MSSAGRGPLVVQTSRLRLIPTDAADIAALVEGRAEAVEQRYGIRFPRPFQAPPLVDDSLPFVLERMTEDAGGWWSLWLFTRVEDGQAVGVGGFAGPPDQDGSLQVGYSIWEIHQGKGYATEATQRLIEWAWMQDGVDSVRATIPPWHEPSIRVATKVGMRQVGVGQDDEVGEIHVYEIIRPR